MQKVSRQQSSRVVGQVFEEEAGILILKQHFPLPCKDGSSQISVFSPGPGRLFAFLYFPLCSRFYEKTIFKGKEDTKQAGPHLEHVATSATAI